MTVCKIDKTFSMSLSFLRIDFSLVDGVAIVCGEEFMERCLFFIVFVITNHQRLYSRWVRLSVTFELQGNL